MKTFKQIIQEEYGTEDELDHILPRLNANDIVNCVEVFAEQVARKRANEKVAEEQAYISCHLDEIVFMKIPILEPQLTEIRRLVPESRLTIVLPPLPYPDEQ